MKAHPDHRDHLASLRRIEGQVRGIQKMVEEGQYCVDILIQIRAAMSALARVEGHILSKHFEMCVRQAVLGSSQKEKDQKLAEIMALLNKFRNF